MSSHCHTTFPPTPFSTVLANTYPIRSSHSLASPWKIGPFICKQVLRVGPCAVLSPLWRPFFASFLPRCTILTPILRAFLRVCVCVCTSAAPSGTTVPAGSERPAFEAPEDWMEKVGESVHWSTSPPADCARGCRWRVCCFLGVGTSTPPPFCAVSKRRAAFFGGC